jgi:hypothetical protein
MKSGLGPTLTMIERTRSGVVEGEKLKEWFVECQVSSAQRESVDN